MLSLQGVARWGQTPQNARNRKAALGGPSRMSAAMEAEMARRLEAFAKLGMSLTIGAGEMTPPDHPGAPIKSL
jgi:hypothetical protein